MRKYLLIFIVLFIAVLTINGQEVAKNMPSVILDGKLLPFGIDSLNHLTENDIEQMSVIKEMDKAKLFGINNNNGLLIIITKAKKNSPENIAIYKKLSKLNLNKKPIEANGLNQMHSKDSIPNDIFDFVSIEKQPQFPGGIKKFQEFISQNIRYPKEAIRNKVYGRVFLSFIVETDGSLTNINVMRGLGSGCDEEAVRVLKASPNWEPGFQNGKPVRVKYNINVSFIMS